MSQPRITHIRPDVQFGLSRTGRLLASPGFVYSIRGVPLSDPRAAAAVMIAYHQRAGVCSLSTLTATGRFTSPAHAIVLRNIASPIGVVVSIQGLLEVAQAAVRARRWRRVVAR